RLHSERPGRRWFASGSQAELTARWRDAHRWRRPSGLQSTEQSAINKQLVCSWRVSSLKINRALWRSQNHTQSYDNPTLAKLDIARGEMSSTIERSYRQRCIARI